MYAVRIGRTLHEAATLEAISKRCRTHIRTLDLGSSQWSAAPVYRGAERIGNVSYNGRVWPPGTWTPGMQPLYCPNSERLPS